MKALSIPKFEVGITNEDAALAKPEMIAVSDGAGGGGLFADLWSNYLVEHLPEEPIIDFKSFDAWIDSIWETFYNKCEEVAEAEGGMLLNKFYDEGSFATLVAVWKVSDSACNWIAYGDSVAFCYNNKTKELQHSFTKLADFNNPPFLINCKDPLSDKGFRTGSFCVNDDCVVFATSDALAHYVLMMYEVDHADSFAAELKEAIQAQTKNSNFIKSAMAMKSNKGAISKMLNGSKNKVNFKRHIQALYANGLIGHDDYSLAIM